MYTIGELSKIVKVSIESLRYYDEIGLLKPYHVDTSSRYRYYTSEQVNEILTIMEWKQYGFSLDAIRELLRTTDRESVKNALNSRLQQLKTDRSDIERSLVLLQERILIIEGEMTMSKKTVLIVDDSAFLRKILKEFLENHGISVIGEAVDGEEGITMYAELNPHAVILDIGLPGINGIQAAKKIKEIDGNAKILMCSAKGQMDTILESFKAGAGHFVVKPFLPEILLEAFQATMENNHQYDADTIASIQTDHRISEISDPVSQETITDLLKLCIKGNTAHKPELAAFWDSVRLMEPTHSPQS